MRVIFSLKHCLLLLFFLPFHFQAKEKINLIWQSGRDGLWETDWILDLLADFELNEIVDGKFEVAMDNSIIVVGSYGGDYFSKLREKNYRFGIIHTSDETYSHPTHFYPQADFVFRNYWHKKFLNMENVHIFPLGCKYGFACSQNEDKDIFSRDFIWSFAGQIIDHPTRRCMIDNMRKIPKHFFYEIFSFNDSKSLSTQDYRDILRRSIFSPCPRGYWNLDSFRVYEALEAGCIPIVERQPLDYFAALFGQHPFLVVNSWNEAPQVIIPLLQDLSALEALRKKCHQWWVNFKQTARHQFKAVILDTFFEPSTDIIEDPFDPSHIGLLASPSLKDDLSAYTSQEYERISIMGVAETVGWEEDSAWAIIVEFLSKHSDWKLVARGFDIDGIVVLERCQSSPEQESKELAIDEVLKNRVILCTGPSLNNKQQLIENVEKECKIIPFKKIFISTNDPAIMGIEFPNFPTSTYLLEETGAQLDCLNCMISTIRQAVNDPECLDDDIILFKHETVIINDMYLFRKALGKLIEGYNMVARYWLSDHFYMTDAFFLKAGAARDVFKDQEIVSSFDENYRFCEEYLTKGLFSQIPKKYNIDYLHSTKKAGELGLYHIPRLENSGYIYWNKLNYLDLFR